MKIEDIPKSEFKAAIPRQSPLSFQRSMQVILTSQKMGQTSK